jgi:hypothetical protein
MRVVGGMASPFLLGVDAIFRPQPHGAIADDPLLDMMSPAQRSCKSMCEVDACKPPGVSTAGLGANAHPRTLLARRHL